VFRREIDHAYKRGLELGEIPTNPLLPGIRKPEFYAHKYITGAQYDAYGRVIITFRDISELGAAANRSLVLKPFPQAGKRELKWEISEKESTVPYYLLPLDVTISGEPIFHPFAASTPALVAFKDWTQAIINDDYEKYVSLSWVPKDHGLGDTLKEMYKNHRTTIPKEFFISRIETLPTGCITFNALGCRNGVRRIAIIYIFRENQKYNIFSSAWGTPWNDTIRDCPVRITDLNL